MSKLTQMSYEFYKRMKGDEYIENTKIIIQKEVAEALAVKALQNPEQDVEKRVKFIKEQLLNSGLKNLVLGVSGGVDSLTTGLLCQKAVNELKKETNEDYKFIAVKLPYKVQKDADFVELSLKTINPDVIETFNLGESVDAVKKGFEGSFNNLEKTDAQRDFVIGNVKARMRMIAQYALAGMYSGLVVGTDHASEAVTGFFTKFGDGGFDFSPLSGLVKREVVAIAKFFGAPEALYNKVPTADLEDLDVNKPDENALGVSYVDIDKYLLAEKVSDEAFEKITEWYIKTEHKRQLPCTVD